ncbi:MAG TPA: peptidoglycan-binding domain-containing protein [Rhodopila sp.]
MLRHGIAVGLLAGLAACSNMTAGGGQAARPVAAATQPPVAPDMVRQVQSKLRDGGYYQQGAVDGVWGSGTETAVRSFQRDHNLSSSGQLDVPTLQALNVASTPSATDNAAPPPPNAANPTQPTNAANPPPPADNTGTPATR